MNLTKVNWSLSGRELILEHGGTPQTWVNRYGRLFSEKRKWKWANPKEKKPTKRFDRFVGADWSLSNGALAIAFKCTVHTVRLARNFLKKPRVASGRFRFAYGALSLASKISGVERHKISELQKRYGAPTDGESFSRWLVAHKQQKQATAEASRIRSQARRKAYMKAYCAKPENLARIRASQRKMDNDRRRNDPAYAIKNRLRARFHKALKAGLASKAWRTSELLGCDPAQLKQHIESQFVTGMTWANRRAWHVDHIIPLSAFNLTDPEEQKRACHFTNLKPLWAKLNQKKHARLPASPQPQLRLEYLIQSSSKPSALAVPHFMQAVA